MSMVNIDIIELILDLLAKDCKIILVGDKNQLPPVKIPLFGIIYLNILIMR